MLFKTVLATGLMAMTAAAHQLPKRGERIGCGTRGPSENQRKIQHDLALQEAADRNLNLAISGGNNAKKEDIEVNVYMHSVSAKNATLLSDKVLKSQFDVMANVFSDYDIKMHLAGTSRTVNPKWAGADGDEMGMKLALRRGTYADLNMYYVDDLDAYGYCYYPDAYRVNSTGFWQDGCTVMATTVPGGTEAPYNHGMTSVHEAGHWFGLIHTFGETENGCDGPGDEIHDTPAQRTESRGCPVGRDSCPGKPGVDPIHNYMDYSDDTCYDEFTPGQVRRIRSMWDNFRA